MWYQCNVYATSVTQESTDSFLCKKFICIKLLSSLSGTRMLFRVQLYQFSVNENMDRNAVCIAPDHILCHFCLQLTHWGRVTHICVSKLTIIGSDNGLSTSRRQAIIWTNAGILLIRTLATNFNEILSEINTFSFKKMRLKMSSAKWRPFCLGLNVLTPQSLWTSTSHKCQSVASYK